MNLALILVSLTAISGAVILTDILFWKNKPKEKSPTKVILEYSYAFFPVLLLVVVIRSFIFEPFRIPSGSMKPTLLVGDFIFVKKYSYGLRSPVLEKKILDIKGLKVDQNRLEQEIFFYLDKIDINEEINRLKSNLNLFETTMKSKISQGKKLNFICQEIGREINTIGSKCNNISIQKKVIEMKNNLEKVKEENYNILYYSFYFFSFGS